MFSHGNHVKRRNERAAHNCVSEGKKKEKHINGKEEMGM